MSAINVEWIALIIFLLLFAASVVAEIIWLTRGASVTTGRSVSCVLITDLLGFGIGSLVLLIIFFGMFMMVMGPAGTGSNIPEGAYWAGLAVGIIVPPVLLIACKRVFLALLKLKSGGEAWVLHR